MFTGQLQVEHLALTSVYDLIGGLDLVQQRLDLGDRFAPGNILRIGIEKSSNGGILLPEFACEKRVVSRCLGDDFLVRLSGVQSSEPAFKRQRSSKSDLIHLP